MEYYFHFRNIYYDVIKMSIPFLFFVKLFITIVLQYVETYFTNYSGLFIEKIKRFFKIIRSGNNMLIIFFSTRIYKKVKIKTVSLFPE